MTTRWIVLAIGIMLVGAFVFAASVVYVGSITLGTATTIYKSLSCQLIHYGVTKYAGTYSWTCNPSLPLLPDRPHSIGALLL